MKWEYRVLSAPSPEGLEAWLDEHGGYGWELVTIYNGFFIFKRKKE